MGGRRFVAGLAILLMIVGGGCTVHDYEVVIEPGVATRLTIDQAVDLAEAKFAEWEPQVAAVDGTITPVVIRKVRLHATVEDCCHPAPDVAGPVWLIEADGSFLFPHQLEPPGWGTYGDMVFADATGELLIWGGGKDRPSFTPP